MSDSFRSLQDLVVALPVARLVFKISRGCSEVYAHGPFRSNKDTHPPRKVETACGVEVCLQWRVSAFG